jgi:hypothetical protein
MVPAKDAFGEAANTGNLIICEQGKETKQKKEE